MSGFDAVNEAIQTSGGSFAKVKNRGDVVEGIILDVVVRDQVFEGKVVPNSTTGEPRKEWLFSLDTSAGVTKFAAKEGAQTATRNALGNAGVKKLEKGGRIRVECTQEFKRGNPNQYQEFSVTYTPPKIQTFSDDDPPPF